MASVLLASALLSCLPDVAMAQSSHWVTAYYGGWEIGDGSNGYLPISEVDFSAFTDVIDFALVPNPDGSLDTTQNSITSEGSRKLIEAAHAAYSKVLISVGGAGSGGDFEGATDLGNLGKFVKNLVAFVRSYGFDGIDIDWEPINSQDGTAFTKLAEALHDSLKNISGNFLLTTTCSPGNEQLMALDQDYFDEINVMTYEMSFPSQGWVVWFNSPVYSGGLTFPGLSIRLPSIADVVKGFENAGVVPGKLGIGAELGGTVWVGVSQPNQLLAALISVSYDVPLYSADGSGIMQRYYKPEYYHWDSGAQAGYLSIPPDSGAPAYFISYDDSGSIAAKAEFIQQNKLGGIIIYELGMGYPGKGPYPLLRSVKSDFAGYVPPNPANVSVIGRLDQNYPNPFNLTTKINFEVRSAASAELIVYNILGERITTLVDSYLKAGSYTAVWSGEGDASGVYFCELRVGGAVLTRKMLLIK